MFGFFKKKVAPTSAEIAAMVESAASEVAGKWIVFNGKVKFREEVELLDRIRAFAPPIHEFLKANYPSLTADMPEAALMTMMLGIMRAGTEDESEIKEAIDKLKAIVARSKT